MDINLLLNLVILIFIYGANAKQGNLHVIIEKPVNNRVRVSGAQRKAGEPAESEYIWDAPHFGFSATYLSVIIMLISCLEISYG